MMPEQLAEIIECCGESGMLRGEREHKLAYLIKALASACDEYTKQFGSWPGIPLNDAGILSQLEQNRHRVSALLQALPHRSPNIVATIWRIIQGDKIEALSLDYSLATSFDLTISIQDADTGKLARIRSDRVEDAAFFRHVSIGRVNDKPFLSGYYALRSS